MNRSICINTDKANKKQALYGYSRQHRLLKPEEFQHVFQSSLKKASPLLVCFIRKNEHSCARLGLVITKRRFKHAVDRNKIRRLVRESFRLCANQLGSVDVIVLVKSMTSFQIKTDLQKELKQQWQKLSSAPSLKEALSF